MENSATEEAFHFFRLFPSPTDLLLGLSRAPRAAGSRRAPGVICGCLAVNLLY